MANDSQKDDDLLLGTILIFMAVIGSLIFLWLVGYGWKHLIAEYAANGTAAWIGGLAIAGLALLLATVMALIRNASRRALAANQPARGGAWQLLYPFLFVLSALGLLNSGLYLFAGGQILGEQIDGAQARLSQLESAAVAGLRDPEQEAREAEVNQLLTSLDEEIHSPMGPNSCGVGPESRAIIAAIRQILPNFHELGGRSRHTCDSPNLRDISDSYRRQALEMLRSDPRFASGGGARMRAVLGELRRRTAEAQAGLESAEAGLSGRATRSGSNAYDDAVLALKRASSTYGFYRNSSDPPVARALANLPREIDVADSTGLGSIGQIIPTLAHRLNYLSTWVFFAVALLIDIGLVLLVSAALFHFRRRRRMKDEGRDDGGPGVNIGGDRPARDPIFLWVNPYS